MPYLLRRGRDRGCGRYIDRSGSRVLQTLDQTRELRSQLFANQLIRETCNLLPRGVSAQPLDALALTLATLIGNESRSLGPLKRASWRRDLRRTRARGGDAIRGLHTVRRGSSRSLRPWGWRTWRRELVRCSRDRRNVAIRNFLSSRRGHLLGDKQSVDFRLRGLGMKTGPMSGEKRAPSLQRPDPLGDTIV